MTIPKTYDHSLSFQIVETAPDLARAEMPVTPAMLNPFGTVHAGAMVWLADVTATVCALGDTRVGPDGAGFPLATNLTTVLTANQSDGVLTATAETLRRGRKLIHVRTRVTGREGRLLIELTSTHMVAG